MEKMATAAPPVKQLHNFPLSLKWGAQPYRPDPDSDPDPYPDHDPPPPSTARPPLPPPPPPPPPRVGSRSARLHRFSFTSCSASSSAPRPTAKQDKPPPPARRTVAPDKQSKGEAEAEAGEEEEENPSRPWKLRPRKQNGAVAGEAKEPPPPPPPSAEPKSMRLRGATEPAGEGGLGGVNTEIKKEKRKIWIALSREEIEEDVFIMTGSRPARRPRKRPKNVQKLLDCVFPGLWLVGTAADSYRLAEAPVRK